MFARGAAGAYTLCTQKHTAERKHMSIFDSLANLAKGVSGEGGNHAAVASGLLDHLGGTGGVAGLIPVA